MHFGYGAFRSIDADNFRHAGGRVEGRINQGRLEAVVVSLDFEFTLHYDGQLALSARMATIRRAIRLWGYDVGLYHDNGSPSEVFIRSAETSSGVRITRYPFPDATEGAGNYASGLKGGCGFQAEYLPGQFLGAGWGGGGNEVVVVGLNQSVTYQGTGGPRRVIQEFTQGPPAEYVVADRTKCRATQSGSLVQEANAPESFGTPLAPLWPDRQINESYALTYVNEQVSDDKWRCTVNWNYEFESVGPF